MSENEIQVNQSPNGIGSRQGTLVQDHQRTNDETRHGKSRQRTTGTNGDANGNAINGYGNPEKPSFVQSCKDFGVWQTLRKMVQKNFKPERRIGDAPNVVESLKAIATCSWLNVLLVCIPVSWALHFAKPDSNVLVFVFSFLAIIPLAKLLAFATDEMSMRVGQTLAGLLNATLGNAVELIVAIIAIVKCELQVVQSSLVGSILSNLLLVLGMCFFAGGTQFSEQGFGASATQINSSLLTISVIAVLLPAAFHNAVQGSSLSNGEEKNDILMMSHGVAVILLFIYASYLIFQLWSHTHLYEDKHESNFKSTRYEKKDADSVKSGSTGHAGHLSAAVDKITHRFRHSDPAVDGSEKAVVGANGEASRAEQQEPEEEEEEKPKMSFPMSIGLLVVVTVFVAVTAEFLVDSINGVTSGSSALSKEWVGLILLPIVGNAAEHVTAVTVSVKDKLTLSIGVAVGSSIQIALFVIPLMVIIAWGLGKPLLLLFDPFESVTLFLAVLTVNYVVQDGKSNWLEGMILMCLYVIIAVCFWFYKGSDVTQALAMCT
ncbi:calcium/proton exchanger [Rickenella mellea]|uniref:Calcium/proton exchanger n=1 Tax=Rickenella mellea TaxID=50990 RepID=A0A4Y7QD34_9AGAM|nr:calcium/proton exchanger [Rickenella mellea]